MFVEGISQELKFVKYFLPITNDQKELAYSPFCTDDLVDAWVYAMSSHGHFVTPFPQFKMQTDNSSISQIFVKSLEIILTGLVVNQDCYAFCHWCCK